MTTTHTISADEVTEFTPGWLVANLIIKCNIPRCTGSFTLGFSPLGRPARKVLGAAPTTDLFGGIHPNATVIALHHFQDDRRTITLEVGDTVIIEDHAMFAIGAPTRIDYDRPTLVAVAAWNNGWVSVTA